MKTLIVLSLSLLCGCGDAQPLREDASERVVEAFEDFRRRLMAGDWAWTIDHMPQDLFPGNTAGFRELREDVERREHLRTPEAQEFAQKVYPSPPQAIHAVAERHICVLPYTSKIHDEEVYGAEIAVSDDGGATWKFVPASPEVLEHFREVLPKFHRVIAPELEALGIRG